MSCTFVLLLVIKIPRKSKPETTIDCNCSSAFKFHRRYVRIYLYKVNDRYPMAICRMMSV